MGNKNKNPEAILENRIKFLRKRLENIKSETDDYTTN
jgi:hypothetical protein